MNIPILIEFFQRVWIIEMTNSRRLMAERPNFKIQFFVLRGVFPQKKPNMDFYPSDNITYTTYMLEKRVYCNMTDCSILFNMTFK